MASTQNSSNVVWLRYVIHSRVEQYKALGWEIRDTLEGTPHGQWAVYMKWPFDDPPVEPK